MKEIQMVGGLNVLVDDEMFEELNATKWYPLFDKDKIYANSPKMKRMHRIIMGISDPSILIDHEDGNGLNNQKYNLRICSINQNNANRKSSSKKTSKYLGVYKIGNKYRAASRCNGILKNAGHFVNEIDAALAYNKLAVKHHGEFARLNIIFP